MNREIKFRVWDKNKKFFHSIELKDGCANVGLYYYWENQKENLSNLIWQQFTGLKDKNDKDIYKGDIILCPDLNLPEYSNTLSVVEFHGSSWCYKDISSGKIETIYGFIGLSEKDDYGKIIGNIFENPELLK